MKESRVDDVHVSGIGVRKCVHEDLVNVFKGARVAGARESGLDEFKGTVGDEVTKVSFEQRGIVSVEEGEGAFESGAAEPLVGAESEPHAAGDFTDADESLTRFSGSHGLVV